MLFLWGISLFWPLVKDSIVGLGLSPLCVSIGGDFLPVFSVYLDWYKLNSNRLVPVYVSAKQDRGGTCTSGR